MTQQRSRAKGRKYYVVNGPLGATVMVTLSTHFIRNRLPVAVFSLSPEAHDARVLDVAKAIWRARKRYAMPPLPIKQLQTIYLRQARAALTTLNLAPKGARK